MKKVKANINENDRNLFKYLYQNKLATTKQIARDIYRGYVERSALNRLNKLTKSGLINPIYLGVGKRRLAYHLTSQGFDDYIGHSNDVRKELKSFAPFHDVELVDLRSRFENCSSVKDYLTENLLRSPRFIEGDENLEHFEWLHPDAVIEVIIQDKTFFIPIEYESEIKFSKRYYNICQKYYADDKVPAVIYISKTKTPIRRLQRIEESSYKGNNPKFFYKLYPDLLKNSELIFKNRLGKKLAIS